jgi:hypothetical protein
LALAASHYLLLSDSASLKIGDVVDEIRELMKEVRGVQRPEDHRPSTLTLCLYLLPRIILEKFAKRLRPDTCSTTAYLAGMGDIGAIICVSREQPRDTPIFSCMRRIDLNSNCERVLLGRIPDSKAVPESSKSARKLRAGSDWRLDKPSSQKPLLGCRDGQRTAWKILRPSVGYLTA